ncbi:MAG: DHA2 family efflux MFS transporter permease subunit [Deltaproteobacteria bacterium]|nr:DHA2 family efflux MFS transporter permease subunit [Deltaproteobacteria bacterium]MCW5807017.1 DHA2 family efflux MFS transporter permease subunit [Deltaproteobacteria bacterium]
MSGGRPQAGKWTVALSIAFGSLMATIDTSIVNVAIPQIRGELGASLQEITWVTTAYMIAMVLVMPLTGFLGSFFGQKRVYLASLVVFTVGSVLCGTARSLEMLVLWRIVQGLGGGALQPTQQAILRQTFPPAEQGMAMAVFSMVIMVGPAVGPVLGGWITDNMSWPWIFFVNLPVGVLGIYLTWRNVDEPAEVIAEQRARAAQLRANLDWQGIVLMAIGIGAMMYVLEEGAAKDWFDSDEIVIATYIAGVGIAAFVIRELTAVAPVVDLRMFRDPTFASGTAISGLVFAMLMGSMFLLPVFTQELMHYSATQSGVLLLPRTLAMMIASPIVGKLYNRVRPAWLVGAGLVITAVGCWLQATINLQTASSDLFWPLALTGVGFAFIFVPLTTAALSNVPRAQLASAAGVNGFIRQIGGSIGLSIFATLFSRYSAQATAGIASSVTLLRPEVAADAAAAKAAFVARGMPADVAHALMQKSFAGRAALQGTVIGFDKTFILQTITFFVVLPLLLFLRVRRADQPAHVEMSLE